MGEVYLATDTRLDRSVAIKVLPSHFALTRPSACVFEANQSHFVLNHPTSARSTILAGKTRPTSWLWSTWKAETLASRLKKGALPLEQLLKVACQVANALDKAHRQGVIHRRSNLPHIPDQVRRQTSGFRSGQVRYWLGPGTGLTHHSVRAFDDARTIRRNSPVHVSRAGGKGRKPTLVPASLHLEQFSTNRRRGKKLSKGDNGERCRGCNGASAPAGFKSYSDDAGGARPHRQYLPR